jgi:phenylpyruvate tautomerase
MPFVTLLSSVDLPHRERESALLSSLSRIVSEGTGKDERWVMTCVLPKPTMTMGGSSEPAVYVGVKNIGTLTNEQTSSMTAAICESVHRELGVSPKRIYVEFVDVEPHLFGWNGETFA